MKQNELFGIVVRTVRTSRRLSLNQVAEVAGISISHLSQIERGERRPSEEVAVRLAEQLDSRPDSFRALSGYLDPSEVQLDGDPVERLMEAIDDLNRSTERLRSLVTEPAALEPVA